MKHFDVIGWTFDGAMYCDDHKPTAVPDGDEPQPIFAGSEIEPLDYCDTCLHEWISANPGKSATLERACVYLDQERTEDFIKNEILSATFNRFEIRMTRECAEDCSHSGSCDADVDAWESKVRDLNPDVTPEDIRAELEGYGAWDAEELEDDDQNWARIVWCAANNLKEEGFKND